MQFDLRVLELLSSKICHDLVSPVSAINNGVELIEDIGESVADEAMKLIGDSATQASRRLRLFRMAYGRAGSEDTLAVRDVRQVAEHYLSGGKTLLHWADDQPDATLAERKGFLKTVLNVTMLAEEILAYGGNVTLQTMQNGAQVGCRFEIAGRAAQLNPQIQAALDGTVEIDALTPRTIQAYMTGRLAAHFGLKITHDHPTPERLDLNLIPQDEPSEASVST